MRKGFVLFVLVALFTASRLQPVYAGGWAVVTLDELPAQVVAGQPLKIGFIVRQHGRTPAQGLMPVVTAQRVGGTQLLQVNAQPEGSTGHYVATLNFPAEGTWEWSIDAFGGVSQPMPRLNVLQTATGGTVRAGLVDGNGAQPFSPPAVVGILSLVGALGALAGWMRTRRQVLIVLSVIAVAVGAFSFGLAVSRPVPPVQAAIHASGVQGAALFLAKGCVVCHQHAAFNQQRRALYGLSVGPDLTDLRRDPAYLRVWLADPAGVKPATQMPNLGLSTLEIEDLVAFLQAK